MLPFVIAKKKSPYTLYKRILSNQKREFGIYLLEFGLMSNITADSGVSVGRKHKKKPGQSSSKVIASASKNPVTFIAPYNESVITPIALTKAHFLDAYSKGKWNLSKVPCPPCFEDVGFMSPPDCYQELNRRKSVQKYNDLKHWDNKIIFKKQIRQLRKNLNVNGFSISLIDKNRTIIKYEMLLDLGEIPRIAAIDSHTILSQGYFLLLDASQDWRTRTNPFVKGLPYIKFYCGVPLIDEKGYNIGALSVFDSFAKKEFKEEHCEKLIEVSKEIMKILNTPYEEIFEQIKVLESNKLGNDVSLRNNELKELSLKLGRATSRGGTLMSVFEKDGLGNAYSQNHNFRFSKFLKEESNEEDKLIQQEKLSNFNKLYQVGSLKIAASILSKTISTNCKIDFVYFLEIRISEQFTISNKYFPPNVKKIDAEKFKYANKLIKVNDSEGANVDLMTRIIGIYGSSHQALNFENLIHYKAFLSEFGIKYENPSKLTPYNKGIIMPFYRYNCKLIRKDKGKDIGGNQKINVYLRSGGYLVGLFNKSILKNSFDSQLISRVFDNTNILKTIYITGD